MSSTELARQVEEFMASATKELPATEYGLSAWGDACIRYRTRTVATLEEHEHSPSTRLCLVVKVPKSELPALLSTDDYTLAPYVGRYGWVCMHLPESPDWQECQAMIAESYRLIAKNR